MTAHQLIFKLHFVPSVNNDIRLWSHTQVFIKSKDV